MLFVAICTVQNADHFPSLGEFDQVGQICAVMICVLVIGDRVLDGAFECVFYSVVEGLPHRNPLQNRYDWPGG